jgi:Flp pilus assembly protein TadB
MSEPCPPASAPQDPEVIKQQIDHTRTELAETVEALAPEADVPSRAKDRIAAKSSQLREKATTARHQMGERAAVTRTRALSGAAGAAIAMLMLALFLRRRRNS